MLFQVENKPEDDPEEALDYHALEEGAPPDVVLFARGLVGGVLANRDRLDEMIGAASQNWKLQQMAKVDRVLLRIAVYEIALSREVPVKAAINESIELAKTFSSDESGRFVNGILGKVAAGLGA